MRPSICHKSAIAIVISAFVLLACTGNSQVPVSSASSSDNPLFSSSLTSSSKLTSSSIQAQSSQSNNSSGTSSSVAHQSSSSQTSTLHPIALQARIDRVQPMTGIAFWSDNSNALSTLGNRVQLEFSYLVYGDYCSAQFQCDWERIEQLLNNIAKRGRQAIVRFRNTYPGVTKASTPKAIREQAGYQNIITQVEGQATYLPDWSFEPLRDFTLWFFQAFAERFDGDPRLAFLQVGFGSYSEYHLYDGPLALGMNFPSKSFQREFFIHLNKHFTTTPWMISIDAASNVYSPLSNNPQLVDLPFGVFDDSFMHSGHSFNDQEYNRASWLFFGEERFTHSPAGGEFSYYSNYDQRNVLNLPNGPHGRSFKSFAEQYHISYIIGNDQFNYQTPERIKTAAMATGYAFHIDSFESSVQQSRIVISNQGVAPIYYDAFPAINGLRAATSLKGLLPGETREVWIDTGGSAPVLTIESDYLVNGQVIQYSANLNPP